MKLRIPCTKCIEEDPSHTFSFVNVEINDNGIYEVTCNKGHKTLVFNQQPKFQVLFDLGAMALLDKYPREAVSSFASSLERFYEFCIEVILTSKNIDEEQYLNTWKLVSNQSERQLGAFYFLYLNEFKEAPVSFNNKQTSFRNNVIHKGYIPKYDEVVKYASTVLNYIYSVGKTISDKYKQDFPKVLIKQQAKMNTDDKYNRIMVMDIPTIIQINAPDDSFGKKSFDEALNELKISLENDSSSYTK